VIATIAREQRREIGLDTEQVADRIGILDPIEPMDLGC
jgi:hypothetical protein